LKKSVVFVALFSVVLFSNCKNNPEVAPEEQMEQTINDSVTVVTDSVKVDDVAPVVATKDTLTTPVKK